MSTCLPGLVNMNHSHVSLPTLVDVDLEVGLEDPLAGCHLYDHFLSPLQQTD